MEFSTDAAGAGMRVTIMGRSWAVCLARAALEDCSKRYVAGMKAPGLLRHRVPLPRLVEHGIVRWEDVDGVGALVSADACGE